MKLKNILIVTTDIERSKKFYKELFGLEVVLDNDGNVILTEGLVLQERKIWESAISREVISENNSCELYFEEANIENFAEKLDAYEAPVKYINRLTEYPWGQKMLRFYDLDGTMIEVRTPMRKS